MSSGPDTASELIREIRQVRGISQAELARRAQLSRSVVNAYERGTRQPGVDALARIAGAADMELLVVPRAAPAAPGEPVPHIEPERAGHLLAQVLDLAEALPHRRRGRLAYPSLKRSAA